MCMIDPIEDKFLKKLQHTRTSTGEGSAIVHYIGHSMPSPFRIGESDSALYFFQQDSDEPIAVRLSNILQHIEKPSIFIFDTSHAGRLIDSLRQLSSGKFSVTSGGFSTRYSTSERSFPSVWDEAIGFGACGAQEVLPNDPTLPLDLFTSCLTTPLKMLVFQCVRHSSLISLDPYSAIDGIPGEIDKPYTPLGELSQIFEAIAEAISWEIFSSKCFNRLRRTNVTFKNIINGFLVAQRAMKTEGVTPTSFPKLPDASNHPLWRVLDHNIFYALTKLREVPSVMTQKEYTVPFTPFFGTQIRVLNSWLDMPFPNRPPPIQLPIIPQLLLRPFLRFEALRLLARYVDLGPPAVDEVLSISCHMATIPLLAGKDKTIQHLVIFIWAKIVAAFPSVTEGFFAAGKTWGERNRHTKEFKEFNPILRLREIIADKNSPPDERAFTLFLLTAAVQSGNIQSLTEKSGYAVLSDVAVVLFSSDFPLVRTWTLILLANICAISSESRRRLSSLNIHNHIRILLKDPSPEVRAAALNFFTEYMFPLNTDAKDDKTKPEEKSRFFPSRPPIPTATSPIETLGESMNLWLDPSPLVRHEVLVLISRIMSLHLNKLIALVMRIFAIENGLSTRTEEVKESLKISFPKEDSESSIYEKYGEDVPSIQPATPSDLSVGVLSCGSGVAKPSVSSLVETPRDLPEPPFSPTAETDEFSQREKCSNQLFQAAKDIIQNIPTEFDRTQNQMSEIISLVWSLIKGLSSDPISSIAVIASELMHGVETMSWLQLAKQFPFNILFSEVHHGQGTKPTARKPTVQFKDLYDISDTSAISEVSSFESSQDIFHFGQSRNEMGVTSIRQDEPMNKIPFPVTRPEDKTILKGIPLSFLGGKIPLSSLKIIQSHTKDNFEAIRQYLKKSLSDSKPPQIEMSSYSLPLHPATIGALLMAAFPFLEIGPYGEISDLICPAFKSKTCISFTPLHASSHTPQRHIIKPQRISSQLSSASTRFTNTIYHTLSSFPNVSGTEIPQLALTALLLHEERISRLKKGITGVLSKISSSIFPLMMSVINTPVLTTNVINLSSIQASLIHKEALFQPLSFNTSGPQKNWIKGSSHKRSSSKSQDKFAKEAPCTRSCCVNDFSFQGLGFQSPDISFKKIEKEAKNFKITSSKADVADCSFPSYRKTKCHICQCGRRTYITSIRKSLSTTVTSKKPLTFIDLPRISETKSYAASGTKTPKMLVGTISRPNTLANKMLFQMRSLQQLHTKETEDKTMSFRKKAKPKIPLGSKKIPQNPFQNSPSKKISWFQTISYSLVPPFPPLDFLGLCIPYSFLLGKQPSCTLHHKNEPITYAEEIEQIKKESLPPCFQRSSCAVLVRSLYHCSNTINDNCAMPYSLEENDSHLQNLSHVAPTVVSCLPYSPTKTHIETFVDLGNAIQSEQSRLRLLTALPVTPREALLPGGNTTSRPKTKFTPRFSPTNRFSPVSDSSGVSNSPPRTPLATNSIALRFAQKLPFVRTSSTFPRFSYQKEEKPAEEEPKALCSPILEDLRETLPLAPERSGLLLSDGVAVSLNYLPEQLSFLLAQTKITKKAKQEAVAILKDPRTLVHGITITRNGKSSKTHKKPFKIIDTVSTTENGAINAMAFHSFRALLITIDQSSTLRVHNLKTGEKISQISSKSMRDVTFKSWPSAITSPETRGALSEVNEESAFYNLCGIRSFADANGNDDMGFEKASTSTLDYCLRYRPKFQVSSIKLMNEHSPHALLVAGCSDGAIRLYSNYDTPSICRLASAFNIPHTHNSFACKDTPFNSVNGFWEMWNQKTIEQDTKTSFPGLPVAFRSAAAGVSSRFSKYGFLSVNTENNIRTIDLLRHTDNYKQATEYITRTVMQSRTSYSPMRNSFMNAHNSLALRFELSSNDNSTLFAIYNKREVFAYDLIYERMACSFKTPITPTSIAVDPVGASYLMVGGANGDCVLIDNRVGAKCVKATHEGVDPIIDISIPKCNPNQVCLASGGGSFRILDLRFPKSYTTDVQRPSLLHHARTHSEDSSDGFFDPRLHINTYKETNFLKISSMTTHPLTGISALGAAYRPDIGLFDREAAELSRYTVSSPIDLWREKETSYVSSLSWHPLHSALAVATNRSSQAHAQASTVQIFSNG
eukprot:gnl/Chilomastix_cuspidata/6525.p1 GENE.gnl/Chilomastix_cuspidata/6525~~gnl/Chilomastix_cuspidata/6525.p1  ORF type:complete len:2259 (-),score=68.07 gnl/Chilomastix_cuspidata/6525:42-6452(-)